MADNTVQLAALTTHLLQWTRRYTLGGAQADQTAGVCETVSNRQSERRRNSTNQGKSPFSIAEYVHNRVYLLGRDSDHETV